RVQRSNTPICRGRIRSAARGTTVISLESLPESITSRSCYRACFSEFVRVGELLTRRRDIQTVALDTMTISAIPPPEPVWCLDRRDSGHLFWRRESSKVKFRYDVEVLEFTKDPYEDQLLITDSELSRAKQQQQQAGAVSNMIVVCVTCVAAIAVTVVLPWFLIGSA
ncbi:uncharacterized protein LOC121592372, partial [Anopheles merus]